MSYSLPQIYKSLPEQEIADREAAILGLPPIDIDSWNIFFCGPADSRDRVDWQYSDLKDFRHRTYLMEKEKSKRKRSTDLLESTGSLASGGSLASSVPEDLRIATPPDESPQIRRRRTDTIAAKPRETVANLGERMDTSLKDIAKAHETLKAAIEEVRIIAKEAEKINEMLFEKLTKFEGQMLFMQKQLGMRDGNIEKLSADILQLKRQFEFKPPTTAGMGSLPGSASTSATRPATAIKSGTAAAPPVKSGVAAPFRPPGILPKKKPEEPPLSSEEAEEFFSKAFCAKCGEDYPAKTKHVCA